MNETHQIFEKLSIGLSADVKGKAAWDVTMQSFHMMAQSYVKEKRKEAGAYSG